MEKIKLKLVKSLIGRKPGHIATAQALGLRKLRQEVEHTLNPAIAGMVAQISHLIQVERVGG